MCPQMWHHRRVVVPELSTLEDILSWCRAQGHELAEIVVQDEYTHDVVIKAKVAPSFVVFDTT